MKKGVQADAAYKPPLHLQPVIKKIYNIKDFGIIYFSFCLLMQTR